MLRHLCLLAAAATAITPQNATRQLDAYEPPPTDLSRACASWRPWTTPHYLCEYCDTPDATGTTLVFLNP